MCIWIIPSSLEGKSNKEAGSVRIRGVTLEGQVLGCVATRLALGSFHITRKTAEHRSFYLLPTELTINTASVPEDLLQLEPVCSFLWGNRTE